MGRVPRPLLANIGFDSKGDLWKLAKLSKTIHLGFEDMATFLKPKWLVQ